MSGAPTLKERLPARVTVGGVVECAMAVGTQAHDVIQRVAPTLGEGEDVVTLEERRAVGANERGGTRALRAHALREVHRLRADALVARIAHGLGHDGLGIRIAGRRLDTHVSRRLQRVEARDDLGLSDLAQA